MGVDDIPPTTYILNIIPWHLNVVSPSLFKVGEKIKRSDKMGTPDISFGPV